MDRIESGLPSLQLCLGVTKDLASFVRVGKLLSGVTWHDRGVIEEVEQFPAVCGKDDLLLGTLNSGGEVDVVGLLDLLSRLELH